MTVFAIEEAIDASYMANCKSYLDIQVGDYQATRWREDSFVSEYLSDYSVPWMKGVLKTDGFAADLPAMIDRAVTEALSRKKQAICLYASKMGLSLYESIGFEAIFTRRDFIYSPEAKS
ncbi:MAG: hypothetical protein K2X27_16420 [Candidatus Obscuribacterales bacterium]|nr:hypothetical protein [Candidatus Obscuribacterales bacterium]